MLFKESEIPELTGQQLLSACPPVAEGSIMPFFKRTPAQSVGDAVLKTSDDFNKGPLPNTVTLGIRFWLVFSGENSVHNSRLRWVPRSNC